MAKKVKTVIKLQIPAGKATPAPPVGPAVAPHLNVMEFVKQYNERTAAQIATAIALLLNHPELTLQDPAVVAAPLEKFRSRPADGFSDCLLLEIARRASHLPLGTFDRDLGRFDGAQRL